MGFPGPEYRTWEATNLNGQLPESDRLPLRLTARQLLDLLFLLAARTCPFGLGGSGLTGCPLDFLPFQLVFDLGGICH